MTAALICRSLTVTRGPHTILADVDLQLTAGRCLGVVGPNGIGKSTLLRALASALDDASTRVDGSVERSPASATVGYLAQETSRSRSETVDEFLRRRSGVTAAQASLDAAVVALADESVGAADDYDTALQRWLSLGAADFDARSAQVVAELGLDDELRDRTTSALSGGELARVSLASLLVSRFDVVLLDEPTNDLDLDGLRRLEEWLVGLDAPVALVSHDRAFLERTITHVAEIDHHSHQVSVYAGGWSSFIAERDRARERAHQRYEEYAGKRQTLLDRRQREREWASQGAARLRRSDENDKFIRNYQMNQTEQLAGRSARTDRAIERLEQVEEPRTAWELRYDIPTVERSGDIVATLSAAVVHRGDFRLGPVDLDVAYGDRIAIVGANGSGKSTLIQLLLGRLDPTAGRVSTGAHLVVGEIEQARTSIVGSEGLASSFHEATGLEAAEARALLAKFGLVSEQLDRPGETLSPGERTRAGLAVMMANGANLLVADEPTNHLDLEAITQLEVAIDRFAGTLLVVSHDRAFLDAIRFDRVLRVNAGIVDELPPDALSPSLTAHPR
jgi:ATPase subunit of ABC transporter with duplicated ATPase domains